MLLLQHLFDAMAVAELMWDGFLAPAVRTRWDAAAPDGDGRRLVAWLVGMHDVGKATPAFQSYEPSLWERVVAAGLPARPEERRPKAWRHDVAGARVLLDVADDLGIRRRAVQWIWPLIGGHHGQVPGHLQLQHGAGVPAGHGRHRAWRRAQRAVVDIVTTTAGYEDLTGPAAVRPPARADQLAISGAIILCDWIASNQDWFEGIDDLDAVGMELARERAREAWERVALTAGWRRPRALVELPSFEERFGQRPRPVQELVVDCATNLAGPGMLVVEAPVGEGKTEAAFAAAEILAARTGADGVFVGMPTQATADPMLDRLLDWLASFDETLDVALLHGKRAHNPVWQRLREARDAGEGRSRPIEAGTDEFGEPDIYGTTAITGIAEDDAATDVSADDQQRAAAAYLEGPKLGLLAPFVIGTIDQLLFAATRTRHVTLRFAGLAGKVVVLDEVHAADVYMSEFLAEALRWLGQARVSVVLLSATLSPGQREQLVDAYVDGATSGEHRSSLDAGADAGYPRVTSVGVDAGGQPRLEVRSTEPRRRPVEVAVDLLPEGPDDDPGAVVARLLGTELAATGCVLVLRNTVRRARDTYTALVERFGDDVALLHARLSVADRAERAGRLVAELGPPDRSVRPRRRIVVATQVAEQSLDIDADLLVTDLAPVDLLVQRLGRIHRHDRDPSVRPVGMRQPRMVVTGCGPVDATAPWIDGGAIAVYGRHRLLRTAAVLRAALDRGSWTLPSQVPELVGLVYGEGSLVPAEWAEVAESARAEDEAATTKRVNEAGRFLLGRPGDLAETTLAGLHRLGGGAPEDEVGRAVVRDGDPSAEVQLVRRSDEGFRALDGTWLGHHGERARWDVDVARAVFGGTVRLPAKIPLASVERCTPLPEWKDHPMLGHTRVVELDADGRGHLPGWVLRYDERLGLIEEVAR
ncbi:CRISPR-associated helicase Cas3' [Nitriliruptoraceae bacterium ZYF776]|nr:CRISPR-associated helicase Cas3' [Profundirhabdus halotolerans]